MVRIPESWPGWTPATWHEAPWLCAAILAMAALSLASSTAWRVVLVLLVGHGVAPGEDGAEEEHHTEQRDADPAHVLDGTALTGCRPSSRAGCSCPERDSAIPFRAARSTGSRCICFSLQILRRSLCWSCCGRGGGTPGPRLPRWLGRVSRGLPPGRPPRPEGERRRSRRPGPVAVRRPTRGRIGRGGSWATPAAGGRVEASGRAEAMRRRPMSMSPARPMPAITMMGSVPAQYSPVCTVVTFGHGGRGRRRGDRGGRGRRGRRGHRRRGHGRAAGDADVADVQADAALQSALSRPRLSTPTLALAVVPGAEVSQVSRLPSGL